QATKLTLELKGGDYTLASSDPLIFGVKWISSLGSYKEWDVFGFNEESLVPIINFLPTDLREECEKLLRTYFIEYLDAQETRRAGHMGGKAFADNNLKYVQGGKSFEGALNKQSRGFSRIVVNA